MGRLGWHREEDEKEQPGTRTSDRLPVIPGRVSQCKQSNLISLALRMGPVSSWLLVRVFVYCLLCRDRDACTGRDLSSRRRPA